METAAWIGPAIASIVVPVVLFAMITVIVWVGVRQKEKESAHRHELLRKIAESPGDAAQKVLDIIREQEYEKKIRQYEGLKIAGLITSAVGIALMPFLYLMVRDVPVWIVGIIPLFVGVVMMVYVFMLAPKPVRKNG